MQILVDSTYNALFTFGQTASVRMMVLLNLDATLVTGLNCANCQVRLYNESQQGNAPVVNYSAAYPMPGFNLSFNGINVKDQFCISEDAVSKVFCTPKD